MERDEYISRIRKLLHDPEGKAWDDEELNAMLDYAVKSFCLDTAAFRGDFRFYADENGQCKLPENYVGFLAGWNGEGTHIESASADYLSRRYGNYSAVNGQPQFICEDLNTIGRARLVPNPHALQNGEKLIGVSSYGIPYRINHPDDPGPIPLTLTAVEPSTVKINATGSPTVAGLHYRLGTSGTWLPYTIGTTINLNAGQSVQFWNSAETLSTSSTSYVSFALSGEIEADGNTMSLLNYGDLSSNCFRNLFNGCSSLMSAPALPAKTLQNYCYYNMFNGTGITKPPELPATQLATACYFAMFAYSAIESTPALPAPTLATQCYRQMFRGCTGITSIALPANILVQECYYQLLIDASSLTTVEVNFTQWRDSVTATSNWLLRVASSGTFIKPSDLPEEYGPSRIPTGWTVINK